MLGKYVRVNVTNAINTQNEEFGYVYELNYGRVENHSFAGNTQYAYIMGIDHPVRNFDGRVVAIITRKSGEKIWVVAPKSTRFIINDIKPAIEFAEGVRGYTLECLYESSCGAVVFRMIAGEVRYLLIKNKRSANWGFPKGHIERGETKEDTARREVLEETGIGIQIIPGFISKSEYTIQGKVEKSVSIFVAKTSDTQTIIQHEEIEDYIWLNYDKAIKTLKFENDRSILERAHDYLLRIGEIEK